MTGLSGRSVVIFDTSADTIGMLEAWFHTLGVAVHAATTAADSATAGALVRAVSPDAIVFDVAMPYEAHFERLRRLHDAGVFGATPLIVTTTNQRALATLPRPDALRIHTIVEKPYDVELLVQHVAAAI